MHFWQAKFNTNKYNKQWFNKNKLVRVLVLTHRAKSISCGQFQHRSTQHHASSQNHTHHPYTYTYQPINSAGLPETNQYKYAKHLLQSVLYTCSPLTSGKSISCRQFHKHKQYSTSLTKTQIHAVHLIRRRKAFHTGSFNTDRAESTTYRQTQTKQNNVTLVTENKCRQKDIFHRHNHNLQEQYTISSTGTKAN